MKKAPGESPGAEAARRGSCSPTSPLRESQNYPFISRRRTLAKNKTRREQLRFERRVDGVPGLLNHLIDDRENGLSHRLGLKPEVRASPVDLPTKFARRNPDRDLFLPQLIPDERPDDEIPVCHTRSPYERTRHEWRCSVFIILESTHLSTNPSSNEKTAYERALRYASTSSESRASRGARATIR